MNLTTPCALITIALSPSLTQADIIHTTDGATLTGAITLIDKGVIHLDTAYAGTLEIKQDLVKSFESDEPRVLRLDSGTVIAGPIQGTDDGTIRIQSEDGVLETSTSKVAAAWAPDSEDPEIARNRREWRYNVSFDLSGKDGNTDKYDLATSLKAELKGPDDTLAFFFRYEQAEENDNKTEDNAAGGGSYESFFSKSLAWYVRTELENDQIEDIDLRSTSAGGLSYRLINKDQQSLVARTGLGYRYTSYGDDDKDNESNATLDFGLSHSYQFENKIKIVNDLTYVPAIDDFSNYRVVHDSGLEIPVASSENWKIRMGLKNDYDSDTSADEKMDTSYYTRMIYSWD